MALLDFLKKKDTPAQNDAQPAAPPAAPAPEKPASQPRSNAGAGREDTPRPQGQKPAQRFQWPKYGTDVAGLVAAMNVKVFVDASFVKGPAFAAFRQSWKQNRVNQYVTRYFFLPTFEKQKLTPEELKAVSWEDCREFFCENPEDCFAQMVRKGLKWSILWLTENAENGIAAQEAARKTGTIYLRWYGMDADGKLKSFSPPAQDRRTAPAEGSAPVKREAPAMRFPHTSQTVKIARVIDPARMVPGKAGSVTAPELGKRFMLREPVMSDHSSITYKTDDGAFFAKIYTPESLRIDLFENKAKRMVQEKLDIPGVCWPKDILLDSNGCFVGILVPASRGVQLSQSLLRGTSGIDKFFPGWDKRQVVAAALTILRTVNALQKMGVIFRCFNPSSVYIVSTDEIYFVDADAWQIEGYPVLSRNLTFTPPELLGDPKKVRLFTPDEDNYQAALLAFMLMMPGKYPYAKRNSKGDDEGLRNMSFPFSIGGDNRRSQDAERPSGAWQIVWDHLPYKLCSNFYHSFHHNGNYAKPGTRLRSSAWIEQIDYFGKSLATAEGAQSRVLFPQTFRRDGKRNFVRCNICGREHPDFYFLRTIRVQGEIVNVWDMGYRVCLPCAVDESRHPKARFTCQSCGETYIYTNRTHIMHEIGKLNYDWDAQKWCRNCKKRTIKCGKCSKEVPIYQIREFKDEQRNQTRSVCGECFGALINEAKRRREQQREAERRRKEAVYRTVYGKCGHYFNITVGEKEFYESKGYSLPTRCPRCRGSR